MNNFGEKVSFIWSVADLLRDSFKRSKYPDVILPLTVLRRLDCVLEPTRAKVLETHSKLKGRLENLAPQLCRASGFAFYNTSPFSFERLLQDHAHLAANLRAYINGFSDNMREKNIDLHPDKVSNLEMGYIFEELIRKFNEAMDENPGEHFTPREVVRLMVALILSHDREALHQPGIVRTVSDPCSGTGGMLTITKDRILEINPQAQVHLFGQEVNPETYAVCKSDLFMKSSDGNDAENILFGSTLAKDAHNGMRFDYQLANPPYGKEWKIDQKSVEAEHERGHGGRFGAGLPRISDGQLLFLCHMLNRMKPREEGGARVAIVMNGSPLFTGDAGSGESEIRRWILENDWLEAIVALPEQLFYNTGIPTYVWVMSNHKPAKRKGKVQLIDATSFWSQMRKSLGSKRREITTDHIGQITQLFERFKEGEHSKIFPTTTFGYRKVTIERSLRLNFQGSPERIERLRTEKAFTNLSTSKKKPGKEHEAEVAEGIELQQAILEALGTMNAAKKHMDRPSFLAVLRPALRRQGAKPAAPVLKAILSALSERDETAEICTDEKGNPEPDPDLRDSENVPLGQDVQEFFAREVESHVPDAWVNISVRDPQDGRIGRVGYEINFNRYFYKYLPPRPLEEIEADIRTLEREIVGMLREVAG
jgi:type I restriction enzyme M protein